MNKTRQLVLHAAFIASATTLIFGFTVSTPITPQVANAASCNQSDPTCHGCALGSQGYIKSGGRCYHPGQTATPDTTPPVLRLPANIITDRSHRIVSYTATATDNVDGNIPVTCTPPSGSSFQPGLNVVECTATDHAGNTATGTFLIIISG